MIINTKLCIVAYHDDNLQILMTEKNKSYQLLNNSISQDLINDTKSFTDKTLSISVNIHQISILAPSTIIKNDTLTIPVLIELTQQQALRCEDQIKNGLPFTWQKIKDLPTKLNDREIIQQVNQHINNQYKLYHLTGIRYLLPNRFTARSLSALLSNLTNDFIKYNNIRRKFEKEIVMIKKDHSKKGRPVTIFEYRKQ